MIALVLLFLAASLFFYVLFAGADFGAGIVEIFVPKNQRAEQRHVISNAIAPVWEANHIWLILAVVIVFVAFPPLYIFFSTHLHLPVMGVLMGIVIRGCTFTFRHYDPYEKWSHVVYTFLFCTSSLLTSFLIGVTVGAWMRGDVSTQLSDGFYSSYVVPWNHPFCYSVGGFAVTVNGFLASIYLTRETEEPALRATWILIAQRMLFAMVVSGGLVLWTSRENSLFLIHAFLNSPLSLACIVGATLLLPLFFWTLHKRVETRWPRVIAAVLVGFVLVGWFSIRYPTAILLAREGKTFSFSEIAAPEATLRALLGGLLIGSILIFPSLFYLLHLFKRRTF